MKTKIFKNLIKISLLFIVAVLFLNIFKINQNNKTHANFYDPKTVQNVCVNEKNEEKIVNILNQINNYRQEKGLQKLTLDENLSNAACYYSDWMEKNWKNEEKKLKSHTGDDNTPSQRCLKYNAVCNGEVLAYTQKQDGENLLNLWKNSPTHNEVLLGNYTKIGIGIFDNFITADFQ